jgi:peptidoglycan/LPS O-acetylase OafA/YrhL
VSIDMVKGWAILWVMVIHSQALGDSPLFILVVNRATLIFLVLFGLNAELWWMRRDAAREHQPTDGTAPALRGGGFARHASEWYASRARRLLVPMWITLAAWWALALAFRPRGIDLSWSAALRQLAGWWEGIPTGWFVTAILQLALLFPFLHLLARRFGRIAVFAVGLACTLVTIHWWFDLFPTATRFQHLVFSPRFLGDVTFGLALAPFVERLDWRAALAATAILVPLSFVELGLVAPNFRNHAAYVADLPLTVLLLVVQPALLRLRAPSEALAWFGRRSYELYLAQLLAYFVMRHCLPRIHSTLGPWGFLAGLVAGSVLIVRVADALGRTQALLNLRAEPSPER